MRTTPRVIIILKQASLRVKLHEILARNTVTTTTLVFFEVPYWNSGIKSYVIWHKVGVTAEDEHTIAILFKTWSVQRFLNELYFLRC